MNRALKLCACAVVSVAQALAADADADEMKVEVLHWWTSKGEAAAIQVIADHFADAGGEWIDAAIAGGQEARAVGIGRIMSGDPPSVMQFNTGAQLEEIIASGLLSDLDDIAQEQNWRNLLPRVIVDTATHDDKFFAVPVNLHGFNWIWANKRAFEEAGVALPKTMGDVLAAGPKLKAAGYIPLALGGQPWQERLTFNVVLLAEAGPDIYLATTGTNEIDYVRSDGFRRAAATFAALRDLVDEGSPGRNWDEATAMVVEGEAAMQIMGDWAKAEFLAAGLDVGEDYACIVPSEDNGYIFIGDVFVFPKVDDPAHQAGQQALAALMMAPGVQIAFNEKKGSVPSRLDLDVSSIDACAETAVRLLRDEAKQIPSISYLASPDLTDALNDVVSEFWTTPSMTIDEFVENYVEAIEIAR